MTRSIFSSFRSRSLLITLVLAALVIQAGCGARYKSAPKLSATQTATRQIEAAIVPLNDNREEKDIESKIHLVPIVPFARWRKSKHDEAFASKTPSFKKEIMKAMEKELDRQRAFSKLTYTESARVVRANPLAIGGQLEIAEATGLRYSYGVSFLSRYLHYLGFPKFSRHWNIEFTVDITDTTNNKTLWTSKPIKVRSKSRPFWVYSDEYKITSMEEAMAIAGKLGAAALLEGIPVATDRKYAAIRAEHKQKLARAEQEANIAKGILPPEINISSPRPGQVIRAGSVDVSWRAQALGGMAKVIIKVNGRDVSLPALDRRIASATATNKLRSHSEETPVELAMGDNTITFEVRDSTGRIATDSLILSRLPKELYTDRRRALLIGIDSYTNPLFAGNIAGAKKVTGLYNYLTDQFGGQMPKRDVTTLLNNNATRLGIMAALEDISRTAVPSETVFIYFRGHSVETADGAYLIPAGVTEDLAKSAISITELNEILGKSLAKGTIFIVDAAFKSGASDRHGLEALGNIALRLRNLAVIASSGRGDEFTSGSGTSDFSGVMTDLLKGPDADLNRNGTLTLRELIDKLAESAEVFQLPTPMDFGRYDRDLPLKNLE